MKDKYMKDTPFTKEYEFDSSALDVVEKVAQNPIKVNGNPQRLEEGKKAFKATFIDTEYPTPDDEEQLRNNYFTEKEISDLEWIKKRCAHPSVRHIVHFGLERGPDDKDEDQMTCTITCKMNREWMERFLKLLDVMQEDGEIGHSETLSFFADGDGTFRPWFAVREMGKTGD